MKKVNGVYFPESYQESRKNFLSYYPDLQTYLPGAELKSEVFYEQSRYRTDWIDYLPTRSSGTCLVISTGLHGIEGLLGGAFFDLFLAEYLPDIDPSTGLVLLHAINPWGMVHGRKVNRQNVDLNRNFLSSEQEFHELVNPDYQTFQDLLNPGIKLGAVFPELLKFYLQTAWMVLRFGTDSLKRAALLGQSSAPRGFFFAGRGYQPETRLLMNILSDCFSSYENIIHLDVHTGYGPRRQMALINSPLENISPEAVAESYSYQPVVTADGEDFYEIKGDLIDWGYRMTSRHPQTDYFGTALEFGTLGDGILPEIDSLWRMVVENRVYWQGARRQDTAAKIQEKFRELYYPEAESWREKAVRDSRKALDGILKAEGLLS